MRPSFRAYRRSCASWMRTNLRKSHESVPPNRSSFLARPQSWTKRLPDVPPKLGAGGVVTRRIGRSRTPFRSVPRTSPHFRIPLEVLVGHRRIIVCCSTVLRPGDGDSPEIRLPQAKYELPITTAATAATATAMRRGRVIDLCPQLFGGGSVLQHKASPRWLESTCTACSLWIVHSGPLWGSRLCPQVGDDIRSAPKRCGSLQSHLRESDR